MLAFPSSWLRLGAALCPGLFLLPAQALTAPRARPPAPKAKAAPPPKPIVKTIARKTIQSWLQNPMAHAMSARIMPYRGKKHQGLKLVWVRKKSLYAQLGLRTGDIALKVNGKKLNVSSALGLYSQLPYANQIKVVLLRKGATQVILYQIRPRSKSSTPAKARPSGRKPQPSGRKPQPSGRQLMERLPPVRELLRTPRRPRARRPAPQPGSRRIADRYKSYPRLRSADLAHLLKWIRSTKPDHYEIPRWLLNTLTQRLDWVGAQAAVVPYFKGGKPVGLRITHIKKRSLYTRIGIQNGDVIISVNKSLLTSPQQALKVYNHMASAKELKVGLWRKGKPRTLYYTITSTPRPKARPRPAPRPTTRARSRRR